MASNLSKRIPDVVERVGWTAVQAFLAVWLTPVVADILNGESTIGGVWAGLADTTVLQKALMGALAAAIAFVKATYGLTIGNRATASTLPASLDPATPPAK